MKIKNEKKVGITMRLPVHINKKLTKKAKKEGFPSKNAYLIHLINKALKEGN